MTLSGYFERLTLKLALRRVKAYRSDLVAAITEWRAYRLDPIGLNLVNELATKLSGDIPANFDTFSAWAGDEVRRTIDSWQALRPEMIGYAKNDLPEIWAVANQCGVGEDVETYAGRTFDQMSEFLAHNAVNEATKAGAVKLEGTIN